MREQMSVAELIALLPDSERDQAMEELAPTAEAAEILAGEWSFWARPNQLAPAGDWTTWLILAGRGYGKTRTAVEWACEQARAMPRSRGALVGRTAADTRDILVEGESGILAVSPRRYQPRYEPSKRRITWPNGSMATLYSADKPDLLRGPQHHWAVADELAAWRYAEAWDQLLFGLRLGQRPRVVAATTPRPTKIIRELVKADTTAVTRGSTYDNAANLAPTFLSQIVARYEGTRLGRQELLAEILEDVPGALWTRDILDAGRVATVPELVRVVVGVDPAVTAGEDSNETGIMVVGTDERGHVYVLEDGSLRGSPAAWAKRAVELYDRHRADRIVAEVNQGGEMVEHTVATAARDMAEAGQRLARSAAFRRVHASRGKFTRAEPVSALYEQGRAHHVGLLAELEDQMCTWVPGEASPDRVDALVWAVTDLLQLESTMEVGPKIWD